jgi:hypothetical protein
MNDLFHTEIIRTKLTRNIAVAFEEGREELIMAMDDLIPVRGDGTWNSPRRKAMVHRGRRVGHCPYSRDPSTRDLPHHESCFCRYSSMFVTVFPFYDLFSDMC